MAYVDSVSLLFFILFFQLPFSQKDLREPYEVPLTGTTLPEIVFLNVLSWR